MKRLIALAAVLGVFAVAPAFAQQVETLPSGKKIKIVEKEDGTVIILPADEEIEEEAESEAKKDDAESIEKDFEEAELEDDFDGDLPKDVQDILKRLRKDLEGEGDMPRVKIAPWGDDKDIPEEMRKAMKEMRERMEKFRKEADERFEKLRKEFEKDGEGNWEEDPDAEVEEYEKEAEDGSWKIKIRIVRKTSKSEGSTPEKQPSETPEKSESERKQ